jgi:cytochrome c553
MKDSTTLATTTVCDQCHGNDIPRNNIGW